MVSIFEVLIHIQGLLTFVQLNRVVSINRQIRSTFALENLPYKDRNFFIESRNLKIYSIYDARFTFSVNTTRMYRAYDSSMNRVKFDSEEAQIFGFCDEICRRGENTTWMSWSFWGKDDVYPEYGMLLIHQQLVEYEMECGKECQYMRGQGTIERFM